MKRKPKRYQLVGRSAKTGRFISVATARRRRSTSIVQRIGYCLALLLVVTLPALAQSYTCQQATSPAGFTLSCSGTGGPFPPPPPPTPVDPPPTPPSTCSGPGDISDTVPHVYTFTSGQAQTVCFRTNGGFAQMFGFSVSGSTASSVTYLGTNIPLTTFKPSGSDFRFNPVSGFVGVGVIAVTITMNNVNGGSARFGVQATGAVGP